MRRPTVRKYVGAPKRDNGPIGAPQDSRGLYAAMQRYLDYRLITGSPPSTINTITHDLYAFILWADSRAVTHPEHVTRPVLERYQRWLYHYRKKDGDPLSLSSQRHRLSTIKTFFKQLTRSGEIPANPAADLDLPKLIRRLPRHTMTAAEVERVLAQADTTTLIGLRDRAIMEVLYATGMRRMELAQLQIGSIDRARCMILIREGKGRKDRILPLGARALHWIERYEEHSRPAFDWNRQDNTLFLSRDGDALNIGGLTKRIGDYVRSAQIGKEGSCHLFRHTMATLMLENGADIRFIQAMLGHADLSTTQIYTHVAIKQLQLVHAQTHPGIAKHARMTAGTQDGSADPQHDTATIETLLATLDAEGDEENSA